MPSDSSFRFTGAGNRFHISSSVKSTAGAIRTSAAGDRAMRRFPAPQFARK